MQKGETKKIKFFFLILILILPFLSLISAENVCCERTNTGEFCQFIPEQDCASSNANPTSCDSTTYCKMGTCIDDDAGDCTAGIRKATCENSPSGNWEDADIDELYACQEGCCIYGDNAESLTHIACTQLATDSGKEVRFESSITNEFTCIGLSDSTAKGACVVNDLGRRSCTIEQKSDCISKGGSFEKGLLCTADKLETDCVKTGNTQCGKDERVYFLDSCGNYANVYDATKFTTVDSEWTPEMVKYWEEIQEPSCSIADDAGKLNLDCGDCQRIPPVGTICKEAEKSNSPEFGDYSCQILDCVDEKGNKYKNGEKWCADSPGVLGNIFVENSSEARIMSDETRKELVEGVNKYNLPGSQYTLLTCWDGEITPEPCSSYRNEYCVESTMNTFMETDFKTAWCAENEWRDCAFQENKEDCENTKLDCKWLEGYSFYFDDEGKPENLRTNEELKENVQGSCVPLVAPGFDFWAPETQASDICTMGAIVESVLYEEWFGKSNAKAEERFFEDSKGEYYAEQHCYDSCYAIPKYGDGIGAKGIKSVHDGSKNVEKSISDRRGYYCVNSDLLPSKGDVNGKISCAGDPDDNGWFDTKIRRQYPLFFTNSDWTNFLTTRTRSLGDCGYKPSAAGEEGDPNLETITVLFQILEGKEEEASNVTEKKVIFKGDTYLEEAEEIF